MCMAVCVWLAVLELKSTVAVVPPFCHIVDIVSALSSFGETNEEGVPGSRSHLPRDLEQNVRKRKLNLSKFGGKFVELTRSAIVERTKVRRR